MITQVKLAGAKKEYLLEGHPVAKCEKTTGLINLWDVDTAGLSWPLISVSLVLQCQFFLLQASSCPSSLVPASHIVILPLQGSPGGQLDILLFLKIFVCSPESKYFMKELHEGVYA